MPYQRPHKVTILGPMTYGIDADGYFWLEGKAGREWRLARDRWCVYCGVELTLEKTRGRHLPNQKTMDHVTAKSQGGRGFENLAPCCFLCNNEKGSQGLLEYLLEFPLGGGGPDRERRRRRTQREKRRDKQIRNLACLDGDKLIRALDYYRARFLRTVLRHRR